MDCESSHTSYCITKRRHIAETAWKVHLLNLLDPAAAGANSLVLCSRDHLIELHVSEKMGKNEQLELHQTRLLKLLTSAELVHSIYKEKEFSRVRKKLFWVQLSLSILRSCIGTTTLCGLLIWGIQGQHRVRKLSQVYPNFQAMSSIFPLLSLCLCLVELLWFAIRK